jgi:hypothetical protein
MKSTSIGEIKNETNEVEKLKSMVERLSKQLSDMKDKKEVKPRGEKEISPNTYIKVMSLVNNKLNLSTKARGQGKVFSFEKFGQIKQMFYSELLDIIEAHPNFFEAGYFYVLDQNVINSGNYNELYEKILTKDQMEQILNGTNQAIPLFESCNEKQRGVICNFFIQKMINGENVDYNLLSNITRISGIDIVKRVQEIKETNDNNKN